MAIEFNVTLPEWARQECRQQKSAQHEGRLLAYSVEKLIGEASDFTAGVLMRGLRSG
jgi:hypothetical protein